jgi:hypothetical protein
MDRTFFDIHMHAMDLSHPNLLAFAERIDGLGLKLVFGGLAEPFLHEEERRLLNLLTVMENSIEDYFILLEHFLKHKEPVPDANGVFRIGAREFDTILLTPLIMDFGFKHIKTETFYDMALGKPVVGQTVGILNAIRKYCNYEFAPKPGRTGEGTTVPRTSRPLFEIYPFLGINTRNYDLPTVKELLDRCFGGYTGRRDDLHARMGTFDGAIEKVGSNVFAGVKLYPPLGFDPWPAGDEEELAKVRMLYRLCEEKQIPITAHCSDGGFSVDDKAHEYTNPEKWRQVLGAFPRLKLNLAHFGKQGDTVGIPHHKWRKTVIELVLGHENVYTDISCLAFDDDFYHELDELLGGFEPETRERLLSRILFGSDYMINLLWADSYNGYLRAFLETGQLGDTREAGDEMKVRFCNGNAGRFLFG